MFDPTHFKNGMRRLASGVSLITTISNDSQRHGLVATSVSAMSIEPPSLLVCVNQSASCHDPMLESRCFCVNFLSSADQDIATTFSSSKLRDQRFSQGDWRTLTTGAPALASALASFDCRLTNTYVFGTHTIMIGEVVQAELWENQIHPLLYLNGTYETLARHHA